MPSPPPPDYDDQQPPYGAGHQRQSSAPLYDNVRLPDSVEALNLRGGDVAAAIGDDDAPGAVQRPAEFRRIQGTRLEVESVIEVSTDVLDVLYGVIKYIGLPAGHTQQLVGVELEDRQLLDSPLEVTDGLWHGQRLFRCDPGRGLFVMADQCAPDRRFGDPHDDALDDEELAGALATGNEAVWGAGAGAGGGAVRPEFGMTDEECPTVEGTHEPMSEWLAAR